MTSRQQLSRRFRSHRPRSGPPPHGRRGDTIPGDLLALPPADEPSLLGLPAEFAPDPDPEGPAAPEDPADPEDFDGFDDLADEDRVVVLHRSDALAGSLLLVAGAAGAMSLFLPWVRRGGVLGIAIVREAADLAGSGPLPLASSGLALPLGVAVGAGVLFLLGLLAFRPARTHRAAGTVALFVVLAVASAVVVEVAAGGWRAVGTDPGAVCAVLFAGFGVLGALKAMLTAPRLGVERAGAAGSPQLRR